ncbi:MAG: hypothetical protein N3C13_01355 [Aquificaceae bacterium]|nr:hypothetical protein [Aquificaceae bacterium]
MISGYLSSQQDLVDLLNGCLFNKVGILDLFLGPEKVSLYVERGLILGFALTVEEQVNQKNSKSLLLYHLSELMDNPNAFFTFNQLENKDTIQLEEPISVEELVLQLQLVHSELKALMDRVITPMAVVKVVKNFEEESSYEGKSIYHILTSTSNSLIEEIRKLRALFSRGYLDIYQFHGPENNGQGIEIEYIMKGVEVGKINLINLLDNLQLGKFYGLVEIKGDNVDFNLYYKGGKLFAVYPQSIDLLDFLLNPRPSSQVSVIRMNQGALEIFTLRHSENKAINGLNVSFLEVGKALTGLALEKKTGMITLYSEGLRSYIIFAKGSFWGVVREENGELKVSKKIPEAKSGWIELVFYQPMDNVKYLVYQHLFNILYSALLRHAGHLNDLILSQLSFSETLKYHEGSIVYRKRPLDETEALGFLNFLLDLSYNILGRKKLERELETVLEPYREVIRILDIKEYFTFPEA